MSKMKSLAVFCGANVGNRPEFTEAAIHLGRIMCAKGIRLVYGGGSVGLMGVIADTMLQNGGDITGIITTQLNDFEVGHSAIADMHIVGDMSERKTRLIQGTDGIITLPGGYGSMDELFEVLCLAQLHQYDKPIGLLNVLDYYTPLVQQMDNMVKFGFLQAQNRELCIVEADILVLLDKMNAFTYQADPKWIGSKG